jgi:hypothetical protein
MGVYSMFVEDDKIVDINIFYKKIGRYFECYSEKDFSQLEFKDEEEKLSYKKVNIKMKELTWGLYNEIQDQSVTYDHNGNRNFNYKLYKENRLKKLITSWDAKTTDDKGETVPVPLSEKNIKSLSPEIAELIISIYDDISYFTDEDEKK